MLYANGLYQQDYYHQSCNEKIHICPVIMIHQISRYQVGQLDASQDDDVKPGKENGKIPFGRHPQLNSKVPWILHMPSMKHINHNSGRKVICGAIRLQTNTPNAADVSNVLFVKRNFMRNSKGK